uniref:VWFA domain-containing protein n=1 Tax=Fagus sylvatica TaxID=28930 RepID=A0A2N9I5N7_FAGSY
MAEDFVKAVDDGLKLAKRVYAGKDRAMAAPPKLTPPMDKSAVEMEVIQGLPSAPMVYAVIYDPAIVDNPDIPTYQPHVYGRRDPPALIPLQMNGVELEVDCYLDTAFVRVRGSWRVHCVMGSRSCDCLVAIPMGEQGSILGVEADLLRKSYRTQLIATEDKDGTEKAARAGECGFLKPHIFTLTIPQVDGGSNLSINISWSQKLVYCDGEFLLNVPFTFPEYVTPLVKKLSKKEKIQLNVIAGTGTQVLCKKISHPLKVSSSHIFGSVLLQSPSLGDIDQRETFCVYLFPGNQQSRKVFRKDIVFIVDISGSMRGKLLDDTKNALFLALSKLNPKDSFSIIAFNGETYLFSTSLELATKEAVERAIQWVSMNFIAGGDTNILLPLNKAMEMLSNVRGSVPIIFLVTDGSVEDERHICDTMKNSLRDGRPICPRIYTFGIGSFCNHYFLRMLATIGRGQYDAAYDIGSVECRMQKWFTRALSPIFANITIDILDDLDEVEVYPFHIPDLSSENPMIVSGRYRGNFPDTLKAKGVLADLSNYMIDLKVEKAKDMPIDRVFAKEQIELLTAQAWFSENKQLVEKVAKMSIQTAVASEYTHMVLLETEKGKTTKVSVGVKEKMVDSKGQKMIMLGSLCIGFGDLNATAENTPPGSEKSKLPEAADIFVQATSNCCANLCSYCCCMCCIQIGSRMNNQCAIVITQLCTALACIGCFECCANVCCAGSDGR